MIIIFYSPHSLALMECSLLTASETVYSTTNIASNFACFRNDIAISGEGACSSIPNKYRSSVLQEERVEPCHLSSSIYYGGQEVYSQSPSTQVSGSYPIVSLD